MRSLGISNSSLTACFSCVRPDLSPEDNVIAQELAECSPAPLLGADQVGYSWTFKLEVYPLYCFEALTSFRYEISPVRPSAAKPTKGELLARVEMLSRKSRSVKWKTSDSVENDRPAWGKVPKLGASSSFPSIHVRVSGLVLSPPAEDPKPLSSQPRSGSAAKAKDSSGRATEHPLEVMPITVWNPLAQSVKPPSSRAEELKRKGSETNGDGDSLLLNAELAAGVVSSILKDSDLKRSGALPVEEGGKA